MVENEVEKKRSGWVVPVASVEALRNEDAALFKEAMLAMHDYSIGRKMDMADMSAAARILFYSFKEQMDANTRRYEAIKKRNQETARTRKPRKKNKGGDE